MHARAAAFVGIAIPFVFLALFAFLFAAIAALALALPWWASGLIVGAAFLFVALVLALMAMRSVRKAGMPTPDEAVAQAKATVEEIKEVRAV
jgi:membrane protein implicated in regulation of membrane protease activity